ncbi:hypothetical protein J1N35_008224 [Gossypium stocksii]|uniref:Uncharacterized protein n=1 Tax=Gossypium stocksii TaxID=47602 RepID=A0A9D3W808_9ROSI|nr:hypothetical protein J1N35_008224 [Gossypium stocksii]
MSPSERLIHVSIGDKSEWMSYVNTNIIYYILSEVLANRGMWDAKVSLIVYVKVEMHEFDQVIRLFGWRQQIPLPLRDLKELHKVDMQKKNDEDWQKFTKITSRL